MLGGRGSAPHPVGSLQSYRTAQILHPELHDQLGSSGLGSEHFTLASRIFPSYCWQRTTPRPRHWQGHIKPKI